MPNPQLKPLGKSSVYDQNKLKEIIKCKEDPAYFIENYIKIVSLDQGLTLFKMRDYQKQIIKTVHKNRFTILMLPRQSGKSTVILSYLLYFTLFNSNKTVTVSAHKEETARALLKKTQIAYENIPLWLQQGVATINKNQFMFENGSSISATATTQNSGRGASNNIMLLDEFAFVESHVAENFYKSIYPTVAQSKEAKIVIVSTPNGIGNKFHKLWNDAIHGKNSYVPLKFTYRDVPAYREKGWREEQIANTSQVLFNQEFACEFTGSTITLISSDILQNIATKPPIKSHDGLDIFENPIKDHVYAMTVDPSNFRIVEDNKQDYSAFLIIDITAAPYKVVAKYRQNTLSASAFPKYIAKVAAQYNYPHVLCEVNNNNSVGEALGTIMPDGGPLPNLLMARVVGGRGGRGQEISHYFNNERSSYGVITSEKTKMSGCAKLKELVECGLLLLEDEDIIKEFLTFIPKKKSWGASRHHHDDLVMCLVIFAWMTECPYFKELVNLDIGRIVMSKEERAIDASLSMLGFVDLHVDKGYEIADGCIWYSSEQYGQGLPGLL